MKQIIETKRELCTGCNRCVRECPMEMANITYQDEDENIKVKVDYAKCIACGRCVSACKHNARQYNDDTERFFNDLSAGVPISLISAPAIKTNIPDFKRLFTYLKQIGVNKIYDVSLGADICIWAHVRHIRRGSHESFITQPCPAIVSYCEMYRHDLLKHLSPIHSPMACVSIYMKNYEGITDRVAALSPCVAKTNEFESTGLAEYNVTFIRLREYLDQNNIELPEEETGFDHHDSGLGSLFPMPGGLKENIEFFIGKTIQISKAEGFDVYEALNTYADTPEDLLPRVFDVLSCHNGCNMGSAYSHNRSMFEIDRTMHDNRKAATENRDREYYESVAKMYDETLDFSCFIREYTPIHTPFPEMTDEDIQNAFDLLNKDNYDKQNVDCGACGSGTCHNMARKIALGVNIPDNCMFENMEKARSEHNLNLNALKQLELIWDNVESGTVIIDASTRMVLDANPAAVRIYGAAKEEMIGKKCHHFFGQQKCPILDLNQGLDRTERDFMKADGTIIQILKTAAKIEYNGRQALLESFTDLSHMKDAEKQRHMLEVAEHASHAKSVFLANMSHEIRTPMNAVLGMSELLLQEKLSENQFRYAKDIKIATTALLQIINDILDVSKIESGNMELENIPFDLHELLATCKSIILPRAIEKNIELYFYAESDAMRVLCGDPTRLRQVLINLLSNAVKFTESGKVSLITSVLSSAQDSITLHFEIKDSGIGLTPEQISRIFEPFTQADASTTRKYGGTGLGLSITKNILELMGSSMEIESEPGAGTTISFTIMVNTVEGTEKLHEINNETAEIEKPLFNGTVLVCEDNKMNQKVSFEHLARVGLTAEIAENGQEGIDKVRQRIEKGYKPYDLIFMDIHMPVMDGIEATPKIISLGSGTPIVAMTANIMTEDRELYKALGINDYVGKPFTSQELWRCLLRYLKPAGFTIAESDEDEFEKQLKTEFVKSNQDKYSEIVRAIDCGDTAVAHRLAHNLKSNAGIIGQGDLQKAAADVEDALKGNVDLTTGAQMDLLNKELSKVLYSLNPYLNNAGTRAHSEPSGKTIDMGKKRELFGKLESLLNSGSPESLKLVGQLRGIPGSEELIEQIEDFNFGDAEKNLAELKSKFGIG